MLNNKVVIITGASSGIGKAAAQEFAENGYSIVIAARRVDKLIELEKSLSCPALSVECDVTKESDCENLIQKTIEKFGRIDILVNNAGISMRALFKDLDINIIKQLMDVNFWGTVYCTKYALPHILKTNGSVVGVISIAGYKGLPARTGYSASKFAVYGFIDTLRIEHLKDNIHFMIFAPGFTTSEIREQALIADGSKQGETPRKEDKMMSARECAKHLLKGIKKRKAEVILTPVGKLIVILNKFFPRLVDRLEYNYMKKEPNSPLK
ncbi:MAG: short chain dehydrogenase [Bacteroidetes bacterium GWE2_39_28]|nr:MAG: short chain dehydrogenase [Bacteroidetes bacterium GWE2_39_28]OFY15522.1 MAG: short chain dehydrogenase [Bacteroidetes bacterium GWF2_39_10]OFZ07828.1 MAG: short chain dehydrogenase [Bacteroidetes bacterium RIFOXYB2_FULL_39_7]OFZ10543.1 MAG: short chain dehydrogenase [Bacteroidetes bacterium RIFOXYC2_FULL_39_11]HCT94468.1 short chain dehydrogenase [Rikenellaceae bacterium]